MNLGMLWPAGICHTLKELKAAIEGAKKYYIGKYGVEPNLCFLNPEDWEKLGLETEMTISGVELRETKSVTQNHLWIGRA